MLALRKEVYYDCPLNSRINKVQTARFRQVCALTDSFPGWFSKLTYKPTARTWKM